MKIFIVIVMTLLGFLSGSVMYSYLLPLKIKNVDARENTYDGNPGGSNAMKVCGRAVGLICIFLDILKAYIPVYISIRYLKISDLYVVPIAVAPIFGHAFSPFLHFNGGKAVASTFGSFLALYPYSRIVFIFAFIILFFKLIVTVTPNSSLMIISLIALDVFMFIFAYELYIKLVSLFISIIVIYKQKLHPDEGKTRMALFNRFFEVTLNKNMMYKL